MENTKKLWKYCIIVAYLTAVFWWIETIIFLIIEGFHWKATSQIEIYCDSIVKVGMTIFLILFISVISRVINYILEDKNRFPFI